MQDNHRAFKWFKIFFFLRKTGGIKDDKHFHLSSFILRTSHDHSLTKMCRDLKCVGFQLAVPANLPPPGFMWAAVLTVPSI